MKNWILNRVLPDRAAEPAVIFIHIPKTGGQTLAQFMGRQYRPAQRHALNINTPTQAILDLKKIPKNERSHIRLLHGHTPFGIHQLLPVDHRYVSMVRNPLSRLISGYNYGYGTPEMAGLTFEEYIEQDPLGLALDNGYVRYFAGIGKNEACTPDTLTQAQANIKNHIDFIGLTEQFALSAFLMSTRYNWRVPFYPRANVSEKHLTAADLSDETIGMVDATHALDATLYDWISQRFQKTVAAHQAEIEAGFERFQARNRWIGSFYPLSRSL